MSDTIILFPDFLMLKKEIEKLRTELSMLVLEHDELVYVECKNLEMTYMLLIGGLEYKAYELQCKVLRVKRKIELVQAKKNRQEAIDITEIESTLDFEFAEYQEKLNQQVANMNKAIERSKGDILSESEVVEIKYLYRKIVKALHPDLHPEQTDEMKAMFHNAVAAYENGNLLFLRMISETVLDPDLIEEDESTMALLIKEKERLYFLIERIKKQIEIVKNRYPYKFKAMLEDLNAVEERKQELEVIITQLKDSLVKFKSKLEKILRV